MQFERANFQTHFGVAVSLVPETSAEDAESESQTVPVVLPRLPVRFAIFLHCYALLRFDGAVAVARFSNPLALAAFVLVSGAVICNVCSRLYLVSRDCKRTQSANELGNLREKEGVVLIVREAGRGPDLECVL